MIGRLPRKGIRGFNGSLQSIDALFGRYRRSIAGESGNPGLRSIHFHTLRHWHATMLCHRTKYVLLVKSRLGHKRIDNALLYTQLIIFEGDGYHSAKAKTVEEASKLVEAGFVCVREFNENKVFSKGK